MPLTLVGDVIDLKLPWLAGHSRQVGHLAVEAARLWGLPAPALTEVGKAALIHGLGRAAVSNHLWNTAGPAHTESEAGRLLKHEASRGLFDGEICEAVIAAARGERKFSQPKSTLLTPRECHILLEISHGASNKQVARNLGISASTVRTHMETIFRKLGCSTRASATLKGLTLGLIA